jgi:hypothetical protein
MARLLPANSVPNARFLGNTECDRDTGLACNWTNLEGKSVYRSCSTRACSLTTACRGSPNLRPNPDTVMTADQLVDIHPEVQNELTSRRSHLGATAFDRTTTPLESFVVPSSLGSGVGGHLGKELWTRFRISLPAGNTWTDGAQEGQQHRAGGQHTSSGFHPSTFSFLSCTSNRAV